MMKRDNDDYYRLTELIRQATEQEPPPGLKSSVMTMVGQRRPGRHHRLLRWLLPPYTLHIRPAQLAGALVVILAFWAGMQIERNGILGTADRETAAFRLQSENARTNYLIGRALLDDDKAQAALPYLRKAVRLAPGSVEYSHWQGIAYGALGYSDLERSSYSRSMQVDPGYLPSRLNLGHNALENGNYIEALKNYLQVLSGEPDNAEALYNSALAYHMLGNTGKERLAFRQYLGYVRTGKWALRAVEHLHDLGDFGYRSYRIGRQKMVLNMEDLLQGDGAGQRRELEHLSRALRHVQGQELHIIVFDGDGKNQARAAALDIRQQLKGLIQREKSLPIRASWFDTEEMIAQPSGMDIGLSPSVLFFTRQIVTDTRRNST